VATINGRRGPRGIELHRTVLEADDVTVRAGIPVTALARTVLDHAAVLEMRPLRSVLRQAERVHRLDLAALRESVDAAPARSRKHARLRRALDTYVPGAAQTEADGEMAFLELCARHGLPRPECQVPVGRWRVDFLWRDVGLVVEIDDRQSHDGYVAFRDDRVRDRAMKAMGLEVLRFTRIEVLETPAAVARELAQAHARRATLAEPIAFRALSP
jgi:very-short-patch-repair endonuclease